MTNTTQESYITQEVTQEAACAGKKIYFSNSISGVPDLDREFGYNLVNFMINHGAHVLSEHVAARTPEGSTRIRKKNNISLEGVENIAREIRKQDIDFVDNATHFIAIVNSPSHGVGMEIERALLKPARGLPATPILCLVHESRFEKLSGMISGVGLEESSCFYLKIYKTLEYAQ